MHNNNLYQLTATISPSQQLFFQVDLVSRYQNVSIQDFIGARMTEVVVTTGAVRRAKLQSNHHHQQTPNFLEAGCLSCHPVNMVRALQNIKQHTPIGQHNV